MMSESSIPLSSLTIVPATPDQQIEFMKRSYPQWGKPKGWSFETYKGLGEDWNGREACKAGRFVLWVLTKRDELESVNFLCSCETFLRPAIVVYPNDSDTLTNHKVENVTGYGIASVFTPPENRGKGYASHMMRLLHWMLAPLNLFHHGQEEFPREVWGDPPKMPGFVREAKFSVLYSDIGARFYVRLGPTPASNAGGAGAGSGETDLGGWIARDTASTVWKVDDSKVVGAFEEKNKLGYNFSHVEASENLTWKWLDETLLKKIWPLDAKLAVSEMARESNTSSKIRVAFSPEEGVGSFMVERYKLDWEKLEPIPTHWGLCKIAQPGDAEELDVSVFATWTLTQLPGQGYSLGITRLRCPPHLFKGLFNEILSYAKAYSNVKEIEVWNLAQELRGVADDMRGNTYEREEHLPSIKWYGSEDVGDVDWALNERFCWC
ncbi:hypothetical protein CPB83DRAFT_863562 [Crepidotus variabilis]|uniref:LYC1 C-terminal domain-containing protein n=1 Tax=Crepidotus variabilis TaxID=179855 RepID=A0A9P6JJ97_9AGAR|nr:hypothetical protein CPB83DRAFT_863562 [Crepidotus variabilis]